MMKFKVEQSTWGHFARWAYAGYIMHGRCAIVLDPPAPGPAGPTGEPSPAAELLAVECSFPPDWLQAVAAYDPERELVLVSGASVFVVSAVEDEPTPRMFYEQHAAAL